MPTLVSLAGITEALDNLNIKPGTQKANFVNALRAKFPDQETLQNTSTISTEDLIKAIWGTDDPQEIQKRRKSLSSLKSSVNKSLKRLSKKNKNSEGIIISRDNVFEVSEEQKSALLEKLGASLDGSTGLAEIISALQNNLPEQQKNQGIAELNKLLESLEDARQTITALNSQLEAKEKQISTLNELPQQVDEEDLEIVDDETPQQVDEEDLEIVEDETPQLVDEEDLEIVDDETPQQIDEEDLEIVEDETSQQVDEEDLEIVDDETPQQIGEEDLEIVEDETPQQVDEEDLEIVEDETPQQVDKEDLEIVEEEDVEIIEEENESNKLMEVLSKYMEPEDALKSQGEILTESEEGIVAQLLARFTPKFIKIPGDNYPTGSNQPNHDEHPLEIKEIKAFYLGQFPVTNDIFELFVRETGYKTEAEIAGYGTVHQARCVSKINPSTGRTSVSIRRSTGSHKIEGADWRHPSGPNSSLATRGTHPVVQVSRRDAKAFASWAGKRLPSEEEWEAAAHGRDNLLFTWGNNWKPDLGNFSSSYLGSTTPADNQKSSISPLGIYDLLGNVYEWTSKIKKHGRERRPPTKDWYILKGGCWNSKGIITISHRQLTENTWSNIIGFRCAV